MRTEQEIKDELEFLEEVIMKKLEILLQEGHSLYLSERDKYYAYLGMKKGIEWVLGNLNE